MQTIELETNITQTGNIQLPPYCSVTRPSSTLVRKSSRRMH